MQAHEANAQLHKIQQSHPIENLLPRRLQKNGYAETIQPCTGIFDSEKRHSSVDKLSSTH